MKFKYYFSFFIVLACFWTNSFAQLSTTRRQIDATIDGGYWIHVIDFDQDGDPDILAASLNSGIYWYENNGSGSFAKHEISSAFDGAWSIHGNDIDGDGDIDLVACSAEEESNNPGSEIAWWENDGNENLTKRSIDTNLKNPHSVVSADFDGDGDTDIGAAIWTDDQIVWYENDGNENFSKDVLDNNFGSAHSVSAADMDGDNDADLLGGGGAAISFWRNNGGGNFNEKTINSKGTFVVYGADIDGDGDMDVLRNQRNNFDVDWMENDNGIGGSFTDNTFEPAYGEVWGITSADLDNDGDEDILGAGFTPNEVVYWLNDGNENFTKFTLDNNVVRPRSVGTGDFDKDGDLDMAAITRDDKLYWYEVEGSPPPIDSITLLSPNGGEAFEFGQSVEITWETTGNIPNVRLEYSVDNGTNWTEIIASTEDDGSYDWTVPNEQTTQAFVRASDAADGDPIDASDNSFSITDPSLTLTSPNGGETLFGETSHTITWNSAGAISSVKLEFSPDAGATWGIISSDTENDGSFDWDVPNQSTNQGLVRVLDTDDGVPADTSDNTFSIIESSITVISPNGGELLVSGGNHTITWNWTGAVDSVHIEYSLNGGTSWTTIVASTINTSSFNWSVPTVTSNGALIRVSDSEDSSPSDVSNDFFTIQDAGFMVTFPNGGEILLAGSSLIVTWNTFGTFGFVNLEYSLDNGASWTSIVTNLANSGSFPWTLPNTGSDQALVRVSDTDGDPSDQSDTVFSIAFTSLTVTSPNGGELWTAGENRSITWNTTGTIDSIGLDYSTDNGATWSTITAGIDNNGSFSWTVPDVGTNMALARVWDTQDQTTSDASDDVFTINGSSLTVTAPNGGENWEGGSTQVILWDALGSVDSVKIEFSADSGATWATVAEKVENNGNYDWGVPNVATNSALVRISDAGDGQPLDISDAVFSIFGSALTITSPNGGEIFFAGSTIPITWTTVGNIPSITIDFSTNNGANWSAIITSTLNNGSFDWTTPAINSGSVLVRITDANDGVPADVSDAVFSVISTSLTLTSPNGGETWSGGSAQLITWHSTGFIDSVMLDYSIDNGANWMNISPATVNDGIHMWNVPDISTDSTLVRISDIVDSSIMDISDGLFSIDGTTSISVNSNFVPTHFELSQNFPNPFNPTTTITFALPTRTFVELQVFNLLGEVVSELVSEELNAGEYRINWKAGDLPSGAYIYRLRTSQFTKAMKLMLLK